MSKQQTKYWIATHSIERCLLCPTRIKPILKRCTVVKKNRHNLMEVLNDNDCTSFVPSDKLFDTPEEAWADYRNADASPTKETEQ